MRWRFWKALTTCFHSLGVNGAALSMLKSCWILFLAPLMFWNETDAAFCGSVLRGAATRETSRPNASNGETAFSIEYANA